MLVVFYYMFAVIFVHGASSYLARKDAKPGTSVKLVKHYGSVWKSMMSLYQASTGGADWWTLAEPLEDVGRIYHGLFLFFIGFVILALLNILTGLFVDRAMKGVA